MSDRDSARGDPELDGIAGQRGRAEAFADKAWRADGALAPEARTYRRLHHSPRAHHHGPGDGAHAHSPLRDAPPRHAVASGDELAATQRYIDAQDLLIRDLAARLEVAREDERRRIAREIHDELGQHLVALKLRMGMLDARIVGDAPALREAFDPLLSLVERAIQAVRDITSHLHPLTLDQGIEAALEGLAADFSRQSGVPCEFHPAARALRLDVKLAAILFRVAQEALTNVARHARAWHVGIHLDHGAAGIVLEIADDGIGFDAQRVAGHPSRGLLGMRERALAVGGTVDIDSRPGLGTAIRLRLPLPPGGVAP